MLALEGTEIYFKKTHNEQVNHKTIWRMLQQKYEGDKHAVDWITVRQAVAFPESG